MTSVLHYRDPIAYRSDFMNSPNYAPHMDNFKKAASYDGHSSGSESKKQQMSGGKKRPSRAGTRSVTTLTAAQLERKRANDREAQRAIRQRTKDHIDALERQVRDLTAQLDNSSSSKMMELMRRNEELEQENAVLRARLSHAVSALGVPEPSASAGAPSPSDRVQMLSQPRRSSTGTARSVHSMPEIATPASQPGHWQPQHTYAHHVSSPHETPSTMGEVPATHHESVRWSPHPSSHPQHHPVPMPVQDSVHATEPAGMSYPSPYGMESNARSMSYPLENPASLVTSQPMQMSGYGTPTSHPSPHPSDYQRHMSVPMGHPQAPSQSHQHAHSQQPTSAPYSPYGNAGHQGYVPQVSHSSDMPMMAHAPHHQPQMLGEQGQHMMYHMQPSMKPEH